MLKCQYQLIFIMMLDFIYFRIFKFAKAIAMGLSNVAPRAAAVFSFILLFNTAAIFELLDVGLNKINLVFYILYFSLLYYLSFRLFSDAEWQRKVEERFGGEPWLKSVAGNLVVAIICIVTIAFFIAANRS